MTTQSNTPDREEIPSLENELLPLPNGADALIAAARVPLYIGIAAEMDGGARAGRLSDVRLRKPYISVT